MEATGSILIDAPAERVFEHLDDPDNLSALLRRVRFRPIDDAPDRGTGARLRARIDLAPGGVVRAEEVAHIAEHYYPERLVITIGDAFGYAWTLGRVRDRTLVELRHRFSLPGGPVGQLLANVANVVLVQREIDGALGDLKRRVEVGRNGHG
jgi:hypothetical protein